MNVEFVAYGPVREAVGAKTVQRELPDGATVGELLDGLVEEHEGLAAQLYDGGELRGAVSLTVNGRNVDRAAGLDTELSDGDEVRAAPPIHGG